MGMCHKGKIYEGSEVCADARPLDIPGANAGHLDRPCADARPQDIPGANAKHLDRPCADARHLGRPSKKKT
jgi:hypothetical protein